MAMVTVVQVRKWNSESPGPDYGERMVALDALPPGYARVAGTEREIEAALLDDTGFAPDDVRPPQREPLRLRADSRRGWRTP